MVVILVCSVTTSVFRVSISACCLVALSVMPAMLVSRLVIVVVMLVMLSVRLAMLVSRPVMTAVILENCVRAAVISVKFKFFKNSTSV